MKLKSSALIIILSTLALLGLLNFIINRSNKDSSQPEVAAAKDQIAPPKIDAVDPVVKEKRPQKIETDQDVDAEEEGDEVDETDPADLSAEDVKKINDVVGLSDSDLARELDALKTRVEDEELFDKLEDGELVGDQALETKALLERFALLGLEETRRKFMHSEPELRNPLYAHRESLREIRELLEGEED